METILDTGNSWFLERMLFDDLLRVFIVEGIRSAVPEELSIGGVDLGTAYPTDITESSRHFLVSFEDVLAYQVTNESLTTGDEYELGGKGVLRRYGRSRYLDFIRSSSLIDSIGPAAYEHFKLILVDEVVDVIAGTEPTLQEVPRQKASG
jgi:hypothetical protein